MPFWTPGSVFRTPIGPYMRTGGATGPQLRRKLVWPPTTGSISGSTGLVLGETGTLAGRGVIVGTEAMSFSDIVSLVATGSLSGTSSLNIQEWVIVLLDGRGIIVGTSSFFFASNANLPGLASITGSDSIFFSETGDSFGRAVAIGSGSLVFALPPAVLQDKGNDLIVGSSSMSISVTAPGFAFAVLSGSGALILDDLNVAVSGRGVIVGTDAAAFVPAGSTFGRAVLIGTEAFDFVVSSGGMQAMGFIFASAGLVISPTAIGRGTAFISGSFAFAFSESGVLVNVSLTMVGRASLRFSVFEALDALDVGSGGGRNRFRRHRFKSSLRIRRKRYRRLNSW